MVLSSVAGLIINVSDGEGGVVEREAGTRVRDRQTADRGQGQALSRMVVGDCSTCDCDVYAP